MAANGSASHTKKEADSRTTFGQGRMPVMNLSQKKSFGFSYAINDTVLAEGRPDKGSS